MNVRVRCPMLSLLPLKKDAGEMLITSGHEAGRVHSSKAGLGAAEPQSAELNLFRSESLELPKASASAETPSLPAFATCVTQPPRRHSVSVCMCSALCAYAFVSLIK